MGGAGRTAIAVIFSAKGKWIGEGGRAAVATKVAVIGGGMINSAFCTLFTTYPENSIT